MPGTHRFSRIHEELTDFHKSQLQVLLRGMGFDVELTPAYATCKKLVDRPVIGIGLFWILEKLGKFSDPNYPFGSKLAICKERKRPKTTVLQGILGRVVVSRARFWMVLDRWTCWAVSRFAWMLGSKESGVLQFKAQMLDEIFHEIDAWTLAAHRSRGKKGPTQCNSTIYLIWRVGSPCFTLDLL